MIRRHLALLGVVFFLTIQSVPVSAADVAVLAAGAGYRALVNDLCADYAVTGGPSVDKVFGNMAQVTSQARLSGKIDIILGDVWFLKKSKVLFKALYPIGTGKLVVACAGNLHFKGAQTLLSPSVTRIGLPDGKRAIYGKAAVEYLKNTGVYDSIKDKLVMVATIPQTASYIMTGEVDLGFINLTHARKINKKIGSYTLVDEDAYSPIRIVVGELADPPHPAAVHDLLAYLASDRARSIIKKHGL